LRARPSEAERGGSSTRVAIEDIGTETRRAWGYSATIGNAAAG
jgi:hypothetical protein